MLQEHQFGEMVSRLGSEGGFTYDPRKRSFVTSGYSVAAHPAAELRIHGGATEAHMQGYVAGSAPTWKVQKSRERGQEMIGGWRSPEGVDVLDIPKVFPATPTGQTKSRQAQILRRQQASFGLHDFEEDVNPWFPGRSSEQPGRMVEKFPEFAGLAAKRPDLATDPTKYPEITHWVEAPQRKAHFDREQQIRRAKGESP